jgi:hypothetical protein
MALVVVRPRDLYVKLGVHCRRVCNTTRTAALCVSGDINGGKEHELQVRRRNINVN